MTFAVNVLGWVGVVALLSAYWLVSTQKAMGDSTTYQSMNLLGAILVLVNSSYYGAYPSVGVNAAWIAIGAYALATAPQPRPPNLGIGPTEMPTINVPLQRVSVVSSRPFDEIVRRLMGTIGRPDFTASSTSAATECTCRTARWRVFSLRTVARRLLPSPATSTPRL